MIKKQLKTHSKTKRRALNNTVSKRVKKRTYYAPVPPGGCKFNADEFLEAVEKLQKILLRNDPHRFEKEEFIHA